ncbi:MAG TPA: M28 family peptidase [Longimicrobiaceae bacterium]|nr:M28 family peptidase [Longimicrobiaceae bacterium]
MRVRVGLLAHDSMRGREVGTPEKRQAAEYLAGEMARLGLRPAGDNGTFFQAVPLQRRTTRMEAQVQATSGAWEVTPAHAVPVSGLGGLPATARTEGEGEIVFGGYLADPTIGGQELTARQLAGAVVMVRLGTPAGVDPAAARPRAAIGSLFAPTSTASAVLLVAEGELTDFWKHASGIAPKGVVALRQGAAPMGTAPVFLITPETAERLLGASLEGARAPRTGLGSFRYRLTYSTEQIEDRNVVAVLPGSDPARRGEYMTLGAHYDHVGVGAAVNGDSIYSGADDNASGTSALLEVAEYFAHRAPAERPARSILFVWHAAEEAGLLGSEHFTDNPTVARSAMVAHVNLDMAGRNSPDSLLVVGSRRLSTEYGATVEAANASLSQPFVLDYTFDAPDHPEMLYCRSDHWNFARYGIPVVKLGSGLHDDYHQPSDTPEKIEYEKLARVAQLTAALTEKVANQPQRPRVDQRVPPLGTPCQ